MLARGAAQIQHPRDADQSQRSAYELRADGRLTQKDNATKLRAEDIAHIVKAVLEMERPRIHAGTFGVCDQPHGLMAGHSRL